jgi:hypothetical protein
MYYFYNACARLYCLGAVFILVAHFKCFGVAFVKNIGMDGCSDCTVMTIMVSFHNNVLAKKKSSRNRRRTRDSSYKPKTMMSIGDFLMMSIGDLMMSIGDLMMSIGDLMMSIGDLMMSIGDLTMSIGDLRRPGQNI